MSKGKWHKGPPLAIGWWPASKNRTYGPYRFWDGVAWSYPCWPGDSLELVEEMGNTHSPNSPIIWWRYWSKGRAMP